MKLKKKKKKKCGNLIAICTSIADILGLEVSHGHQNGWDIGCSGWLRETTLILSSLFPMSMSISLIAPIGAFFILILSIFISFEQGSI